MAAAVFISHSSVDRKVAETICEALENRGLECWIACRDVGPGENFQESIVRAIRAAKVMVLVFTASANNSNEIKKELALGSRYNLTVIPVRMEDIIPSDAFELELATRQWIDFFGDWEHAVERLAKNIALRVGAPENKLGGAADTSAAKPVAKDNGSTSPPDTAATAPPESTNRSASESDATKQTAQKTGPRPRRKPQHRVPAQDPESPVQARSGDSQTKPPEERFDLHLLFVAPAQKISTANIVRSLQDSGLAEARAVVEKLPSLVLAGVPKSSVETIKASFDSVGAILDVRPASKPGRTNFSEVSAQFSGADLEPHFDVLLTSASADKIGTIKVVRTLLGSSLVEARALVENLPSMIMAGVPKRTADTVSASFAAVGALVDVRQATAKSSASSPVEFGNRLQTRFEGTLRLLGSAEGGRHTPIFSGYITTLRFQSVEVKGSIALAPGIEIGKPGSEFAIAATLDAPVDLEQGLRFEVLEGGRVVGTGIVTSVIAAPPMSGLMEPPLQILRPDPAPVRGPSSLPESVVKAPSRLPESIPQSQHPSTPRGLPESIPPSSRPRGLPEALPPRKR